MQAKPWTCAQCGAHSNTYWCASCETARAENEETFQAELKHYREKRETWAKNNDELFGRSA